MHDKKIRNVDSRPPSGNPVKPAVELRIVAVRLPRDDLLHRIETDVLSSAVIAPVFLQRVEVNVDIRERDVAELFFVIAERAPGSFHRNRDAERQPCEKSQLLPERDPGMSEKGSGQDSGREDRRNTVDKPSRNHDDIIQIHPGLRFLSNTHFQTFGLRIFELFVWQLHRFLREFPILTDESEKGFRILYRAAKSLYQSEKKDGKNGINHIAREDRGTFTGNQCVHQLCREIDGNIGPECFEERSDEDTDCVRRVEGPESPDRAT